jgi:hypothetical protein
MIDRAWSAQAFARLGMAARAPSHGAEGPGPERSDNPNEPSRAAVQTNPALRRRQAMAIEPSDLQASKEAGRVPRPNEPTPAQTRRRLGALRSLRPLEAHRARLRTDPVPCRSKANASVRRPNEPSRALSNQPGRRMPSGGSGATDASLARVRTLAICMFRTNPTVGRPVVSRIFCKMGHGGGGGPLWATRSVVHRAIA